MSILYLRRFLNRENECHIVPTIISSAASLLGGIFGSSKSSSTARQSMAIQREENRLNRLFNAEEAQKSRDFNLDMFNRTNEYNDPKNVVNRLVSAGLNPNLAFGGVQSATPVASSAQASSNGSVSPMSIDYSGIQNIGASMSNAMLAESQAKLADAQARKTEAEIPWIDELNSVEKRLKESGIDVNISTKDLNENEGKKILKELESLDVAIDNAKKIGLLTEQQIREATSSANIREIEEDYAESQQMAILRKTFADSKLSEGQLVRLSALLTYEIAESRSRTELNTQSSNELLFSNAITADNLKKYGIEGLSDFQYRSLKASVEYLEKMPSVATSQQFSNYVTPVASLLDVGLGAFSVFGAGKLAGAKARAIAKARMEH